MTEYTYSRRSGRNYEPEYVEETSYITRGRPTTEIVYRGRRDDDSVEDITRDFPPGSEYRRSSYRDDYTSRRARSVGRRDYYDDDYYTDYGTTAGGAAAGYGARRGYGDRRGGYRNDGYYSDYDDQTERSAPRRERRKSKVEEALEGVGLGGLAAAFTKGGKDGSREGSRRGRSRRGSSSSSSRSARSKSHDARKKWQQAAKAAVTAGVIQAIANRNEPGPWTGPKGQRALTAALGAAGIDGFLDRDPEKKSKRHIIESVVGGLAVNRVANGPSTRSVSKAAELQRGRSASRNSSRSRTGLNLRERSRSILSRGSRGRSRSREPDNLSRDPYDQSPPRKRSSSRGLKEVAAVGGLAAVGKAIYDRVRSKSRGRQRSRSASSEDSYVPERRQQYQRNRGAGPDNSQDTRVGRPRGRGEGGRDQSGERKRGSSSSSVSTTDLENQRKRTSRKELLTAGLATVATIHAAHGVYSSMVASEKRHKLVMEGEMSPEEARKRKSKNMLQDAAAIGIAALGIKSAFSEWKEMNEQRHSVKELEMKHRRRQKLHEKREKEEQRRQQNTFYGLDAYPQLGPNPSTYADGNPYASVGQIPAPPMGVAPGRYN